MYISELSRGSFNPLDPPVTIRICNSDSKFGDYDIMSCHYPGPPVRVADAGVSPPLPPERGQVPPPASLGVDRDPPRVVVRDGAGQSDCRKNLY